MLHARNRLGLTLVAGALALSACGGGSDAGSASGGVPSSSSAPATATGGTVTHIPATPGASEAAPSASGPVRAGSGGTAACPLLVASEAAAVIGTAAIVLPSLDPETSVICSWVPRSGGPPSLDVITVATQGTPDYFTFNDLKETTGLFGERGFVDADRAVFQKDGLYVDITFQAAAGGKQPGVALMTAAAQKVSARLPG